MTKSVNELRLEWSPPEEPSCSRMDQCFLAGRHQAPRQCSSPFFSEVHDELTISWHAPPPPTGLVSVLLLLLLSHQLMVLKRKEIAPASLDESVGGQRCAIGWKTRASHPSKLCICPCWTRILGGWTSGFGAAHYSCASGLPEQDACQ